MQKKAHPGDAPGASQVPAANSIIVVGMIAPDFVAEDTTGNKVALSDLRGKKKAAIYFYPRDFTPGCSTEAMEFTRDYRKFQDEGIEVIGVSPDSQPSHDKFREKMGIPYLLAADTENIISKSYGVYGTKQFMGKEYMGVNRSTFLVGKDGRVFRVFLKVKPTGHSQEILDAFR